MVSQRVFYGGLINPLSTSTYEALPKCLFAVSAAGEIDWIVNDVIDSMVQQTMAENGSADAEVIALKRGEFIMPGFVDTHTHAPQLPNLGSGHQYELLDWLENVTFPMEAKFNDVEFARRTYESVVQRIIGSGTTTCCYYGTLHLEATKALADIVHASGQRAFVGKCNMDRSAPDYYIEPSAATSVTATESLISHIRALKTPLVNPILTPRFAISCTSDLLTSLGSLAASDPSLAIQTHVSENTAEVAYTKTLFPECRTYTGVYDAHGLLRGNTILAHAVHLEDEEMVLIQERGAGVSHCPTSNFNLRSGMARVGEMLDRGIKVGLGTDVSGGYSPSMLTAIQHASICSKMIALQHIHAPLQNSSISMSVSSTAPSFANRQLPLAALLHLATLGGAQLCNLESTIGSFAQGKAFDALLISVHSEAGNPALWSDHPLTDAAIISHSEGAEDELRGMLERFLFCGDDRNVGEVYVQGRLIGGTRYRR